MSAVAESEMSARTIRLEIAIVLAISFGMSAFSAILQFASAVLMGLSGQRVALNPRRAELSLIDLGLNLVSITRLVAWGHSRFICCGAVDFAHLQSGWAAGAGVLTAWARWGWPRSSDFPGLPCTSVRAGWA